MAAFYNQATLSYNGRVTSSNITVGEITESLGITKTALSDVYSGSDTVSYVIGITNSGVALSDVSVTDDLGTYAFGAGTLTPLEYVEGSVKYYINGALQPSPQTLAGPPLSFSGIDIPAGGNVLIIYEARANEFAPLATGSTITNTATASGGGIATPLSAEETVTVLSEPILSVIKSLSPTDVTPGGDLTYTFTIQNSGNAEVPATGDMVISDTFSPALSDITVIFNGVTLVEGVGYTYDEATGLFATLPGALSVEAATFTQGEDGSYTTTPGISTLTVSGTI